MILKECYVSSFGKLKDFKYNFDKNINVINRENGFGKTTLTIFIKSMFYGLNDSKRDVDNNERKKYKPWNSLDKFGGYLIFEKKGLLYKIERFFGNKESEDTCVLTDLTTGKTYENCSNLGKQIFEIDEEGFYSTTFFSQKDFTVKSNTSLTSKFNAVNEIDSSLFFDKALQKVMDKAKEYKYSGDRGLINDTKRKITQTEIEINNLIQSREVLQNLKKQELEVNNEISILKDEIQDITEKVTLSAKYQAYKDNESLFNRLSLENKNILEKIDEYKNALNNNKVTDEEIKACKNSIDELNGIYKQKEILSQDIEQLNAQKEELKNKKNTSKTTLFFILSALILTFSIVFLFINYIVSIPFFALFLACLIPAIILLSKNESTKDQGVVTLLDTKQKQLDELKLFVNSYIKSLDLFFARFNLLSIDYSARLEELKKILINIADCEKSLKINNDTLSSLNFDASFSVETPCDYNPSELKSLLNSKNVRLQEKLKEQSNLASNIKHKESEISNLTYLENKLEEHTLLLSKQQEELEILKLTSKYLQKADENLKIRYKTPIQNAFDKYLNVILSGKMVADIDIDFNVLVNEQALTVQPEYFSKGLRNVLEICKRLSLIEVLFVAEKPFIILDDPFSNLDGDKIDSALETLKELSKEYQIIYFTCHNSRANLN